jgi:hypothetical protein
MDRELINRIARAVLYEGYILYPYRASSLKNSKRWTFGTLYPQAWTRRMTGPDRSDFHCECLLRGTESTTISVLVRFLQLGTRNEGVEREFPLNVRASGSHRRSFSFPDTVEGEVAISAPAVAPGTFKVTVEVRNTTEFEGPDADRALMRSLVSAHTVLTAHDGEFVSMTDPPAELAGAASECVNAGVWPVLVGKAGERDTILASPIILPDYPEVAPESAGDLFDATEIEEILTLRILTLTDDEKEEARRSDEHARRILERADSLPAEHLMRLHGTIRGLTLAAPESWSAWDKWANPAPLETVRVRGVDLRTGDRVRLFPNRRADIMDTVLEGKTAVIEAIEQDFEDNVQLAVVVEDDPGRDLGEMRQAGHRFFFSPSEVEPVDGSR